MGAVNRQLQAQLDEPAAAIRQRRATPGAEWIDALVSKGVTQPSLVRTTDGKVFVVEGDEKRPVHSGILAAGLEDALGEAREVGATELGRWADGVQVELFEAPDGPPFVVVGGMRRTVRGIPLPHPVTNKQASEFAQGDDVNVAAANISRARFKQVSSPQFQVDRLRKAVKDKGIAGTGKAVLQRTRRKLRGS